MQKALYFRTILHHRGLYQDQEESELHLNDPSCWRPDWSPTLKITAYTPKSDAERRATNLVIADLLSDKLKGHHIALWSTASGRRAIQKFQENFPGYQQLSDLDLSYNLDHPIPNMPPELAEIIAHDYSVMFAYHAQGPVVVRSVDQSNGFSFYRQTETTAILTNPNIQTIQDVHLDENGHLVIAAPIEKWMAHYGMKKRWLDRAIHNIQNATHETYPTARMELLKCFANAYNVVNSSDNNPTDPYKPPPSLTQNFHTHSFSPFTSWELAPFRYNHALRDILTSIPDLMTALSEDEYRILEIPPGNQITFRDDMTKLINDGLTWDSTQRHCTTAATFKSCDALHASV